jgi:dienelactone hydrolase
MGWCLVGWFLNLMMRHWSLVFAAVLGLAIKAIAADPRADFLKLIDRPPVPLLPQVNEMGVTNGVTVDHFSFASDAQQRVPGILMEATGISGRRPVVIVLHGTGGRKEDEESFLHALVGKGFIGVAIDGRYHGERTRAGHGSAEYQDAIVRAWQGDGEHPFFYDTVRDVMRLVDYLQTRGDVDARRIGLTGISKGGIETYLTAAVDKRIAVAAPFIGVQSFEWALKNDDWQGRIGTIQNAFDTAAKESGVTAPDSAFVQQFYDRVAPEIYSEFDGPKMLPLIAPRPLLIVNSDRDENCPLPGVQECIRSAQAAYATDQASNRFAVIIQKNTGHAVKPESERAAVDWFVKWLRP